MSNPLVSVVVPTINSESFLENCLRSIRRQSYSEIEIIIVDNYSIDKTREISEKFGAKVVLSRGIGLKLEILVSVCQMENLFYY